MKIFSSLRQVHAFDEIARGPVGHDVGSDNILPHAELDKDVRRHMERVWRGRRNPGIDARRGQGEDRVIRIVERVNDEVGGAGMVRVVLKNLDRNRRCQRLPAEAFVRRPHGAQQGKSVENRHFVILGPAGVHARHRVRVGVVARQLVAGSIEELVHRFQIALFLFRVRFGEASFECRRQALQRFLGSSLVLLRPQRMVVAHGFAPVGQREIRIELLGFVERHSRLVELEAVKVFDSLNKISLGSRAC